MARINIDAVSASRFQSALWSDRSKEGKMLQMQSRMEESKQEVAHTPRRRLSLALMALVVVFSVAFDQVSKIQAEKHLMTWTHETELDQYQGRRHHILTLGSEQPEGSAPFVSLDLNYVRNLGAAWGALSSLPGGVRQPFFFVVTIVAVVIIGFYFRTTPANHRTARWALALILSGAIGNFLNRVTRGYVIDWIDVRWNVIGWRYFFPNFNWADICITVGVTMLMFDMLILEKRRQKAISGRPLIPSV